MYDAYGQCNGLVENCRLKVTSATAMEMPSNSFRNVWISALSSLCLRPHTQLKLTCFMSIMSVRFGALLARRPWPPLINIVIDDFNSQDVADHEISPEGSWMAIRDDEGRALQCRSYRQILQWLAGSLQPLGLQLVSHAMS